MKKLALASTLVLLMVPLLAACSGNSVVDVAGTWDAELISSGTPPTTALILNLDQTGADIEGTLSDTAVPPLDVYPLDGTVAGDRIEFVVTVGGSGTMVFEGVVDGDSIEGWAVGKDTGGAIVGGGAFTATRN